MKIKTSELTGLALRWAVATCEGLGYRNDEKYGLMFFRPITTSGVVHWDSSPLPYDTDGSQGWPIIEREGICLLDPCSNQNRNGQWHANCGAWGADGPTALISAMRCYVASKLGEEVDVPEELCESVSKL